MSPSPELNPMERMSKVGVTHAFSAKEVTTDTILTSPLTGYDVTLGTKMTIGQGFLVLHSLKDSIHSGYKLLHVKPTISSMVGSCCLDMIHVFRP